MSDQADKIIAEALGMCWHEFEFWNSGVSNICKHCKKWFDWNVKDVCEANNINFATPEGFFKIMEIGPSRDWWRSFIQWWWRDITYGYAMMAPSSVQEQFEILLMREFNPALFSGKLVEFLKERNK